VIPQKNQTLAIIGQGYVGLPLAMAAASAGWTVIGVDSHVSKVQQINAGLSPVEDVSNEQLQEAIAKGTYKATVDFSAVSKATVVTICVPTPLDDKRQPDLTFLRSAATGIAPFISNGTLVISESTSYPGTLRDVIIPIIDSARSNDSQTYFYASAPERVNPGDPVWNQKNTPRLIGGINSASLKIAMDFYASICDAAIPVTTPEVAEAAKLLENTFRLVNIALINEFTQLCALAGINVQDVIDAASTKPYGFMSFRPGVGVGGHCIPVDPLYLTWWARQYGGKAHLIESADSINHEMPRYVAERALNMVDSSITKPNVLLLGVAYKPGVADVRETPALDLRNHLIALGANVAWHDPLVLTWEDSTPVDIDWECDIAILATKQHSIDVGPLVKRGIPVLDCTNSMRNFPGVESL